MGQRKIAAFICLNLNLYVFLIHAIEGIKIEKEGEWENYTQIIFEPYKKRTCLDTNVWLYIVYGFLCFYLSAFATS